MDLGYAYSATYAFASGAGCGRKAGTGSDDLGTDTGTGS